MLTTECVEMKSRWLLNRVLEKELFTMYTAGWATAGHVCSQEGPKFPTSVGSTGNHPVKSTAARHPKK